MGDYASANDVSLLRYCPECGRVATTLQIRESRYDFDCPGCERKKWSEFVSDVKPGENLDEEAQPEKGD